MHAARMEFSRDLPLRGSDDSPMKELVTLNTIPLAEGQADG
jgi:hypothetical protein